MNKKKITTQNSSELDLLLCAKQHILNIITIILSCDFFINKISLYLLDKQKTEKKIVICVGSFNLSILKCWTISSDGSCSFATFPEKLRSHPLLPSVPSAWHTKQNGAAFTSLPVCCIKDSQSGVTLIPFPLFPRAPLLEFHIMKTTPSVSVNALASILSSLLCPRLPFPPFSSLVSAPHYNVHSYSDEFQIERGYPSN